RYFCSILGPTYPNRLFLHSAQTDRLRNGPEPATVPTIWDQLNTPGGPTGRYYYTDVPFVALWGTRYQSISAPLEQFRADAAAGQDLVDGRTLLGFRVPCIVASPFSRGPDPGQPTIDRFLHDHTSILQLIEWRFDLHPLTARDASTRPDDPQSLLSTLRLDAP